MNKSLKNIFIKNSVFSILSLSLFFFVVLAFSLYIYGFTKTYVQDITNLNDSIYRINFEFLNFNKNVNIDVSEARSFDNIKANKNNLFLAIDEAVFPKNSELNKTLTILKEQIEKYLNAVNAYLNDSDVIWGDIRQSNINTLKATIDNIEKLRINIIKQKESVFFKLIIFYIFFCALFFILVLVFLFFEFKIFEYLFNFLKNTNFTIKNIRNNKISIEDIHNALPFSKYEEIDEVQDNLFSLVADFYQLENNLNISLDKNIKDNTLFKSFNKFAVSVLNSIPNPILVCDLFHKIIFVNLSYSKKFNCNLDAVVNTVYDPSSVFLEHLKLPFLFGKDSIGEIVIFDSDFTTSKIDLLKQTVSLKTIYELSKRKRNLEQISKDFFVLYDLKKSNNKVSAVFSKNYFGKNTTYILNGLIDDEISFSPEYFRLLINIFFDDTEDLKIVIKRENGNFDVVVNSKNSKLANFDFIKYFIQKFETDNNAKIEYYSNNGGTSVRVRFLEA